jgi:hypothetical protein
MMDSRHKFIKVTEEMFIQLGFEPPEMNHDKFLPLAMQLEIEKIDFELVHSTSERSEDIIVLANVDEIKLEHKDNFLSNLMKINLELARNYSGCFGVDPNSKNIIYLTSRVLEQIDAAKLLQELREISAELRKWTLKLIELNEEQLSNNELDTTFSLA